MKTYGIIARFDTTSDLLHAAEKIRDAGFKDFDCHSPFPVHGLDDAMGLKRTTLGYLIGAMGMTGALFGFAGPRVVKDTTGQDLPDGFQRSEFLLENGFIDFISHRNDLKKKINMYIDLILNKPLRSYN